MVFRMAESQIIVRLDDKLLRKLDENLKVSGFKTRNEWFRSKVRDFLEDVERKRALSLIQRATIKGMKEDETAKIVNNWRKSRTAKAR